MVGSDFGNCVDHRWLAAGGAAVTLSCRPLTVSDYADARQLYAALSTGDSLISFEDGLGAFAQLLSHPGTTVMGAAQAGRIVSMATLHLMPNMTYHGRPFGLIENVVTLPDARGKGCARAVMAALAETAQAASAYKIMLLTGRDNDAKGFYERLGYNADEKHGMILRLDQPS
jgi:GNAT superfamily N-acetyltransferase